MEERISVIMSTYNEQEDWLRKSIESILNQTYTNLEVIIVIDNPQNEVLTKVIQELSWRDSRIQVLKNPQNMGLVQSLNRALQQATGTLVARMDADDISYPQRLEQEYQFMREQNIDFVMGTVDYIDEDDNVDTNTFEKQYIGKSFNRILRIGNISSHPTWLLKREIYQKLGGYRDIDGCEDFEFLLRAVQHGYRCGRMSQHILCYRMRSSGISRSKAMEQFLRMDYWRNLYRKDIQLDTREPTECDTLIKQISPRKYELFQKAMEGLWEGKKLAARRCYIRGAGCILKGMFRSRLYSRYVWDNIKWLAAVRLL